jgi:hypothetical protein
VNGNDRVDAGAPPTADDELLVIDRDERCGGGIALKSHGVSSTLPVANLDCVPGGLYLGRRAPAVVTAARGVSSSRAGQWP